MKLIIGTRGSALALWQARYVAAAIEKHNPGFKTQLTIIKTRGDKILDSPLAQIGGKGLFTKEIEDALLENRVDLAVHSMKDLPTELPEGLHIGATLKREDPRDVYISRDGRPLQDLGPGARIGTSSLRRKAFLLNRFPDLEIISIRGNVDTRLKKMETEDLAGLILAAAGIVRMGFSDKITSYLEADLIIPAIGQGALAIETRSQDTETNEAVAALNDTETEDCVRVERAFLKRMGGGCQVPMAAHCVTDGKGIEIMAGVVHPDGNPILRDTFHAEKVSTYIGVQLADVLLERGADRILKSVLSDDWEPGPTTDIT
jgi:hydroxymethylbilane synthase